MWLWLALLAGAFAMTFLYPQLVYIAWPLLVIGFLASNFSRQLQFEAGIGVATQERVSRALKGLNNRYWLGNYVQVGRNLYLDHVLVGPEGVLVLETRNHTGNTRYEGGKWRRKSSLLPRVLGVEPNVGNPTRDVEGLVELARQDLTAAGFADVPVSGALVFTAPNSSLTLDNCPITAVTIRQLESWTAQHRPPAEKLIDESTRHSLVAHYSSRLGTQPPVEPRASTATR